MVIYEFEGKIPQIGKGVFCHHAFRPGISAGCVFPNRSAIGFKAVYHNIAILNWPALKMEIGKVIW